MREAIYAEGPGLWTGCMFELGEHFLEHLVNFWRNRMECATAPWEQYPPGA